MKKNGPTARLSVRDTGKGIETTLLPHVFELSQQGDHGTGRATGLGLGLAIAREVVTLHSGSIHAESPGPDEGSTFTVILPIEQRRRKTSRRK